MFVLLCAFDVHVSLLISSVPGRDYDFMSQTLFPIGLIVRFFTFAAESVNFLCVSFSISKFFFAASPNKYLQLIPH